MSAARLAAPASTFAIAFLLSFAPALPAATPDDAFKVPREAIIEQVKSIGVLPLDVADVVPDAEGVAARLEPQVISRLEAAGFAVVPPAAMREIREHLRHTLGGLYDPMTGEAIGDKVKAVEEYADNEYASKHKVDAILRIGVLVRRAPTDYSIASWDGITESTSGRTGLASFLTAVNAQGTTPALSFVALLKDSKGTPLYAKAGGLQVLAYMRGEGLGVKHRRIDPQFIMTDAARDARALAIALDPLTGGNDPAAKAKIALAPAAIPEEVAALRIPRAELLSSFGKVALAPLELGEIEQRAQVQARYREGLQQKLIALGFTVVDTEEYGALWEAERTGAGGYFDPFTGRRDEARWRASRARVFAQMRDKHGVAAIVFPAVAVKPAQFQSGSAGWDGVRERVTASKSWLGTMFNPNAAFLGELSALSLDVRIVDADDRTLFQDSGGIQVAERLAGGELVPVPEPELFSDAAKDTRAIDLALKSLSPVQKAAR